MAMVTNCRDKSCLDGDCVSLLVDGVDLSKDSMKVMLMDSVVMNTCIDGFGCSVDTVLGGKYFCVVAVSRVEDVLLVHRVAT